MHGVVYLPPATCRINGSLVINTGVKIQGSGSFELFGNLASGGANSQQFPTTVPYLTGSVFLEGSTSTDAISITASGTAVDLVDFGIKFNTLYTTTGNGITALPPVLASNRDVGIDSSHWSNVKVFGTDGNHYAFELTNIWYSTFENLRGYGGGTLHIIQNSTTANYGNAVFIHPYGVLFVNGTAHNFFIDNQASMTLNLLVFQRMQGIVQAASPTIGGVTAPGSGQFNLQYNGDVERTKFEAPDLEAINATGSVHFPTLQSSYDNAGILNGQTNFVNINPNSGPINQNTGGTQIAYYINATFNPSAVTNAFLQVSISPNSNMSSSTIVCQLSYPAAIVFDNTQGTCPFVWPAGYYMQLNFGSLTTLTSFGPTIGNIP